MADHIEQAIRWGRSFANQPKNTAKPATTDSGAGQYFTHRSGRFGAFVRRADQAATRTGPLPQVWS